DQIYALAPHLLPMESPHRPAEREADRGDGDRHEHGPKTPAPSIEPGHDGRYERGVDEGGECAVALAERPPEEAGRGGHEAERGERHRIAPLDHGIFRSRVSASTSSRPRSASAGQSTHG